jgi:hypothetical protein
VKFLGQASPEKGLTETVNDVMGMIGGLSDFLSKPSDFWTILWRDDLGRARGEAGQITNTIDRLTDFLDEYSKNLKDGKGRGDVNINLGGITIPIDAKGGESAREIQREIAEDMESGRSPIIPAIKKAFSEALK